MKLRALVPNADQHFWPGQFVHVRLVLTVKNNAVLIPNQATQISQKGPFVYVVNKNGQADLRPIVPGQRQGDMIVVEQGVEPGEQVIVTGQLLLQPGAKVTVQGAGPGPGGPPTASASAKSEGQS